MKEKRRNGKNRRKDDESSEVSVQRVSPEVIRGVSAVFLTAVAGFLILASTDKGGAVGVALYQWLSSLLGVGYMLLPLSLILLSIAILRSFERHFGLIQLGSMAVFLLAALGLLNIALPNRGGIIGNTIAGPLSQAIDTPATIIFLAAFIIAALIVAFNIHLGALFTALRDRFRAPGDVLSDGVAVVGLPRDVQEPEEDVAQVAESVVKMPESEEKKGAIARFFDQKSEGAEAFPIIAATGSTYTPPPVSILAKNRGRPEVGDVKVNMNIIKRTLQNFGIMVEMDEASIGPTVTRYAMKPAEGVRLSKIVALQSNLELALAAAPVRIEAPIPGKSLVGIEVPNIARTTLGLAPLISDDAFAGSDKPLLLSLGRSITGTPHYADLGRMPHLLVAGTTGAGKTCSKDTYVFSEKGMLTFEELCPLPLNSEMDYSLRVATRDGIETTNKNYNNGICDFHKIVTEEGLSIEVTEEHPLWVIRDGEMCWQNGGSIQVGEYVAISRGSKLFGAHEEIHFIPISHKTNKPRVIKTPTKMTKELGLFFGLLAGDGGLTVNNRIVFTQANEEVLQMYRALLKNLFDIHAPTTSKSGQSNKAKDIVVHSKHLKDFLAHLGLKPVGAKEKEMPLSIRQSGPEIIKAFIQGLMRCDGHISSDRAGLEITLANKKILQQVQITLLNFGIVANLHSKKVKNYEKNNYWRLTIYGAEFATYTKEIGFLTSEERRKAERALVRIRNTNRNVVPTIAPLLKKLSSMYRGTFAQLINTGWHYEINALVPKYAFKSLPSYASGVRNPSYEALTRILSFYQPLADSTEYKKVAKINEKNFYWARVARIERTSGEGYDFEVPGSHSFVGNGFVNHNSVAIHDFIVSLLYRCGPERLRFIMIDPKRVELTLYNSIPHLLTPVITDAKKAILAIKWLAKEMERRYNILETESVRDISSYHENIVAPSFAKASEGKPAETVEAMPYIVVVIDELADIMSTYPRELEAGIVRLAQMSRAVGIHLILSTQRPSVKVITGLIKANIPARVAFQVAAQIDSRTILDTGGAEKLLGAGDMLFLSGEMSKPRRIQAPLISEIEVKKVVAWIARESGGQIPSEIDFTEKIGSGTDVIFSSMVGEEDEDDELYPEAKRTVIEAGKASTSYLQRKLGLGYARAARLMDILEERGVIGPADGAKPREVIGLTNRQADAGNADELTRDSESEEETERV